MVMGAPETDNLLTIILTRSHGACLNFSQDNANGGKCQTCYLPLPFPVQLMMTTEFHVPPVPKQLHANELL